MADCRIRPWDARTWRGVAIYGKTPRRFDSTSASAETNVQAVTDCQEALQYDGARRSAAELLLPARADGSRQARIIGSKAAGPLVARKALTDHPQMAPSWCPVPSQELVASRYLRVETSELPANQRQASLGSSLVWAQRRRSPATPGSPHGSCRTARVRTARG